jgi:hypothetical protein
MNSFLDLDKYFIEFTFPKETNTPTKIIFITRYTMNSHATLRRVRVTIVAVGL